MAVKPHFAHRPRWSSRARERGRQRVRTRRDRADGCTLGHAAMGTSPGGAGPFAALDGLVGDEPGVAAAAHARRPPPATGRRSTVLVVHAQRQPVEPGQRPAGVKWNTNSWQSFRKRSDVDGLVVADRQVLVESGPPAGRLGSMAIDLIQCRMFCSRRCGRAAWATSRAVHGSVGLAPTFRKSDPCAGQQPGRSPAPSGWSSRGGPGRLAVVDRSGSWMPQVVGRRGDDDVEPVLGAGRPRPRAQSPRKNLIVARPEWTVS